MIVFVLDRWWLPRVRVGGIDDESEADEEVALIPLTKVEDGGRVGRVERKRRVEESRGGVEERLEGFRGEGAAVPAGEDWWEWREGCGGEICESTSELSDRRRKKKKRNSQLLPSASFFFSPTFLRNTWRLVFTTGRIWASWAYALRAPSWS